MTQTDYKAPARKLDAEDPLAAFRDRFNFPDSMHGLDPVYLCGNSLGLQPKAAIDYVNEAQDAWARHAVRGHFHGDRPWTRYHRLATSGLASLTGARASIGGLLSCQASMPGAGSMSLPMSKRLPWSLTH